ncbi:MAG: MFS transporter [Alicycliphilus sp.]|jgi:DHA2 family multidrug resistance protein-like MFS transporter|uniref:MFS transporter n=1 Tax=Diaphorobacter limosus TaxID=3036128 RepID=A0ABZ0J561_9BURK|nr:MFS transporter [Diaphorobacter sp. Y-1]MBP6751878.1 MFS transporter [Alicycliphilus sp.]MCA0439830.1 MFS transporter [Pseudomonadota bacterium]MBP7326030.1 MFS transporter [Alicycliphilus sp.]MBP7328835.1 MFS transporter [Alicycliphilus sp.]MBP8138489.1 MFS transporter [Alicycliphilus sp.]
MSARPPAAAITAVSDGLPQTERRQAMRVIILGLTLAVLDTSLVNLALPDIARLLQSDAAHSVWVVNAYQLATLIVLLPLSALGERWGYRRVYLVGMAVFAVASLGAMLAQSMAALIAARALQGLGAAGVMAVNAALVRLIYPRAQLGQGMALNSLVVATASMAGPTVAAAILSVASWHWLFAMNLPLGLYIWRLGRRALPANPPSAHDAPRFSAIDLLLNGAMFTLIFLGGSRLGVGAAAQTGGGAAGAWLLLAGLAVGALFLWRQRGLAAPLFPVDLLRIPVFALSMGSSVGAFCAQMMGFLALPFLLLQAHGRSHLQAGLLITAWPLATALVAPLAGRLIGRYPDGLLGGIGMAVFAAGLLSLGLMPAQPADWDMAWRMALCGAGFALFQSPNNHTIVTSAPLHRSGAASGMLGTARLTGQTLGAVLLAAIFALRPGHDGSAESLALLLAAGWAVAAGVCSSLRVRQGPV